MKMFHKSLISLLVGGTALFGVESAFATCSGDYITAYQECVKDNLPTFLNANNQKFTSQTTCISNAYNDVYASCVKKNGGSVDSALRVKLLDAEKNCRDQGITSLQQSFKDNSKIAIKDREPLWTEEAKKALLKCVAVVKATFPPPPPPPPEDKPPVVIEKAEKTFSTTIDQLVVDYHKFVELDKANAKECVSKKIIADQRTCRLDKRVLSDKNRGIMDAEAKTKGAAIQAQIDAAYAEYVKVNVKKAKAWKATQDKILGSGISSYNSLATVYKRMKGSELEKWDAFNTVADNLLNK